jgi:hypothetical protein
MQEWTHFSLIIRSLIILAASYDSMDGLRLISQRSPFPIPTRLITSHSRLYNSCTWHSNTYRLLATHEIFRLKTLALANSVYLVLQEISVSVLIGNYYWLLNKRNYTLPWKCTYKQMVYLNSKQHNFTCGFVWVWNLVSHVNGRT